MALISASDYNAMQSDISLLLGTGTGDKGYGQAISSSPVLTGAIAGAQEWIKLRNDILKVRQHQIGITPLTPVPGLGLTIVQATIDNMNSMIVDATANRLAIPPDDQVTVEAITGIVPKINTTAWNTRLTQTVTINFASAEDARFFFNSGSAIQFTASLTGATANHKNTMWKIMLSTDVSVATGFPSGMGIISFYNSYTSCSGLGTNTSIGWYSLTGTDQKIFQQDAKHGGTFPYYNAYKPFDTYQIFARKTSTTQIVFTVKFNDDATGGVDEFIDGTLTSTVQARRATGPNVSVTPIAASISSDLV